MLPSVTSKPYRPRYHFLPLANWMNDPNGLIQWQGQYHLFYQHNPSGATWGRIHWGHAVSRDLVHWTHLPIALSPTPDGPDHDGCWSGCAVDNNGVPTLIYTGVYPEVQCLATGSDDLIRWEKYPQNPVIAQPPDGLELTGFRDPFVWRDGDGWNMVLGAGIKDVGGAVLLYTAPDLLAWHYVGQILTSDSGLTEQVWECPCLFPLGDKHVLIVSMTQRASVVYFVGTFDGNRFIPERRGRVDEARYFFAPQTFAADDGRRLMFGWIYEGHSDEASQRAGWAGIQSLPRVLSLRPDGQLGMEPAAEIEQLRGDDEQLSDVRLEEGERVEAAIRTDCAEIIVEIAAGDARRVGVQLRYSSEGREQTVVAYDYSLRTLFIDRSISSAAEDAELDSHEAPLTLSPDEILKLRIFLDRSVIEVFANGRVCLTSRIYPAYADSLGIGFFATGGDALLKTAHIWKINDARIS